MIVVDDLSNTSIDALDGIEKACGKRPHFEQIDLKDKTKVAEVFKTYSIEGIIHFAAFKAVGESVEKPLEYYDNNLSSLVNLLAVAQDQNRKIPFIFSSSCTVYGEPETLAHHRESKPSKPALSPYGNTKQICEEILSDLTKVNANIPVIALRYFNPIGAHASAEIGEVTPWHSPKPCAFYHPIGGRNSEGQLQFLGTTTPPKTEPVSVTTSMLRTWLKRMLSPSNTFNSAFGTPKTLTMYLTSGLAKEPLYWKSLKLLNVSQTLHSITKIGKRRSGDVVETYADTTKINSVLGWKSSKTLEDALRSAWNWEKKFRGIS